MSINKMLIDATHPEETRVVVLRENRVEEFDYESAARKLLRGSIYLAKITRVEPSLQAAFVDYGGNRHGFLAFAEVHPDYYQIPHADKLALLEQESREQAELDAELDEEDDTVDGTGAEGADENDAETMSAVDGAAGAEAASNQSQAPSDYDFEANAIDVSDMLPDPTADAAVLVADDDNASGSVDGDVIDSSDNSDAAPSGGGSAGHAETIALTATPDPDDRVSADVDTHVHITAGSSSEVAGAQVGDVELRRETDDDDGDTDGDEIDVDDAVESLNELADDDDDTIVALADDDDEEETDDSDDPSSNGKPRPRRSRQLRPRRRARQYKIQEVIKRRQIVLIQVVKEERGNKGAALTTYLSLAGRYTVLMPNTARGGGISRKITNMQDRKRLKAIAQELEVPEGMGLIIRTAGAARTKQEIKRDFEYLLRLWENVRNLTLESTAPCLVYEEGNLIKRSIRDLYTKEIDEVAVAGDHAHKEAKGFMRMLMPSHAKNVIKHEGTQSLFAKYRIEQQLNAMFSPNVQLKSGGYLVINQTEALVAIDVNSGKSTREFSIEETALNTNLEAADELARQLKLRDLAGLIVVDFIDMEEKRNNRAVERRLKDALKADRARIQVGRISHFGLLEMSRQRLRTGVLEGSTTPCDHCQGSGIIRSIESVALAVLRGLEDSLATGKSNSCVAHCAAEVALYLLNQKRAFIQELEERYEVVVHVRSNPKQQGANFVIEPLQEAVTERPTRRTERTEAVHAETAAPPRAAPANDDEGDGDETKPRRRRRRRGRRDEARDEGTVVADEASTIEHADNDDAPREETAAADDAENGEGKPRRSRRRGRRGGRRHRDQRPRGDDGAELPVLADNDDVGDNDGAEANHDAPHPEQAASVVAAEIAGSSQALDEGSAEDTNVPAVADGSETSQTDGTNLETTDTPAGHSPDAAANASQEIAAAPAVPDDQSVDVEAGSDAGTTHVDLPTATEVEDQADTPVPIEVASTAAEPTASPSEATPGANGTAAGSSSEARTDEVSEVATENDDTSNRTARSQPVASEPVLQRRVIGPNGSGDKAAEPEPATKAEKPSRRGWWQRQFGA